MAPPTLQYGLNLPNKKQGPPSLGKLNLAAGQKRKKTIFDSDSEDEGSGKRGVGGNEVEITEIGGLEEAPPPPEPKARIGEPKKTEEEPPSKCKPLGGNGGKPAPGLRPLKNSIFADDDEDENTPENQEEQQNQDAKSKSNKTRLTGTTKDYANLSVLHSSTKHAKEAQDLDPSIYSYDAIYDSIHSKPSKSSNASSDPANSGPRYMASLLRSAEIRKRDQLRAREKQLQHEREAEGDEFADKEKFVTAAYRAQQEEVRRLEEEEAGREKEEEERRKRDGGVGMVGFYRDMLARGEEKHGEAMRKAQEAAERVKAGEVVEDTAEAEAEEKEKSEAQIAAELNAKGANIVLNDEGQVVDKRQLLSAGLNVPTKPKPKPFAQTPSTTAAGAARPGARPGPASDAHFSRNAQRARQTELIASQLEERARREEEADAARQREIAERTRSRKTESEVSSARERYLARKREREEAAAKGKG
ncbi:hypothetical protein VTN00DRAFT_2628 [Thermoascus crustaceus]|uniref:uncharacterized protein n=1 Tax=Thermoascus crustaceus TaxID=5088 RepID=UPI003743E309